MYDENDALKFIKSKVPADWQYDNDDVLLLIDAMFDYFEMNDEDFDEENEKDLLALTEYVKKTLKRDKENTIKPEYVETMVKAELEYEQTLDEDDF